MDLYWQHGPMFVRELLEHYAEPRPHFNTLSTMVRILWDIGTGLSGFPRDWAHIEYLRMKDYCCWHQVPDDFYQGEKWLDEIEPMFKTAKPMMDFINSVIDDYE